MSSQSWSMILALAKQQGAVTPADVRALGLVPENLNRLATLGRLIRVSRGVYIHPETAPTENHSYVEAAKAVPAGILCLVSALSIHGLGSQNPSDIWMAIPRKQRPPRTRSGLRFVRMGPDQYETGIATQTIENVTVRVTSVEKTLVDCFRLRRLIGYDVPIEALRDALEQRSINIDCFLTLASRFRARELVRPYLDALTL